MDIFVFIVSYCSCTVEDWLTGVSGRMMGRDIGLGRSGFSAWVFWLERADLLGSLVVAPCGSDTGSTFALTLCCRPLKTMALSHSPN